MSWVRRYFLHLLSVIACQSVSIPLAAETTPDISVHVEMRGEVIRVDVDLIIAALPKEVWEVLTDFEHLPRFISNITSSKIVSRVGNTVRIAQSGKTNFGPLTFDFQSEREITLSPFTRFESRMISGNLKCFNGTTQLESIEGGTKVFPRPFLQPRNGWSGTRSGCLSSRHILICSTSRIMGKTMFQR